MQYHSSWTTEAKEFFEGAIKAHGGWEAWERLECIAFKLKIFKGALVFAKGLHRTFHAPEKLIVFPKKRQVDFIYNEHTDKFEDGKIVFSPVNKVVADGRTLFKKSTFELWYPEHAAYFFGYAWANYLSYPFILPKFELLNYRIADSATFIEIKFPDEFHTHCQVQKFYFNHRNMLYRHDYRAEFAGPLVYGAHYTMNYVEHQGLQMSFIRKVRPRIGKLVLPLYGIYGEIEL